jgi:hypothetical protein
MAKTAPYDLVLNVIAPRNRNVDFYPTRNVLRGTVRMSEIKSKSPNGALLQCGMEIPGMQLQLDMTLRHVKIIDRMTLHEFKEKDRQIRAIARQEGYQRFAFTDYEKDYDTNISPEDWPTWLWHIRVLVNAGRFQIVTGGNTLPSLSNILKMCEGRIKVQTGDSCDVKASDQDRPFYLLDARDAEKYETAGAV